MKGFQNIALFSLLFLPLFTAAQARLSFDGYGDFVELNGQEIAGPWTLECWVQRKGVTPYAQLFTAADGVTGIRLEQYINTGKVGITKAGVADWQFNYSVPVGAWTHFAVVNNGTNMTLFINGANKGTVAGTINLPIAKIGAELFGAGALLANVDEVRVWKTALDAATLQQWMNAEITDQHPQWANMLHYYRLDEGAGDTVADAKSGLTGTIHGAQWLTVFPRDVEVVGLTKPARFITQFGVADSVVVRIANVGLDTISDDFDVAYSLDNGAAVTASFNAAAQPFLPNTTRDVAFPLANLSGADIHSFQISSGPATDNFTKNNILGAVSSKAQIALGNITGFTPEPAAGGNSTAFLFDLGVTRLRLDFYRADVFRLQLAPVGIFADPTDSLLVVGAPESSVQVETGEGAGFYWFKTADLYLKINKTPCKLALYKADATTLVWEETDPISFGQTTRQVVSAVAEEHFYGCGMQNGYFDHRGKSIRIENDYSNDWGIGSIPNPAPFFMSTRGYGIFRNTFEKGKYDFLTPKMTLAHNGGEFDAFYFAGGDLKKVLDGYTSVTGRPFLIPRWGLEFGDADCYNDTGETMDGFTNIAKKYRQKDFPGGWMLPNDGYGCGYKNLPTVADSLRSIGFRMGLWTENGTAQSAFEVGQAGVGVYKLDVALVGPGYRSAFVSGLDAFRGIEQNGTGRGYVWTVAGWAGTQRFATIWSGDQYGTWANLKMHIPTVIGAGLSGHNYATGDIDGIFGGSATTYTRDLQWKCFTPAMMTISGWATVGKQPWAYGGASEINNRAAMKQKMRLTPYHYSYCRAANLTGVPAARGMMLEFPNDTSCLGTRTQYQFMSGEHILVAPVFAAGTVRNDIYLPEGRWHDWYDGTVRTGPMELDNYAAPLAKIPLFVREGGIIPQYPLMRFDGDKPLDTLSVDIWPDAGQRQFHLYEDDGNSQIYKTNNWPGLLIEVEGVNGIPQPTDKITATIGAGVVANTNLPISRSHIFRLHTPAKPGQVLLTKPDPDILPEKADFAAWQAAEKGWFFQPEKGGTIHVKAGKWPVEIGCQIQLSNFTTVATDDPELAANFSVAPNPTDSDVEIRFTSPANRETMLDVFDPAGFLVKNLLPSAVRPGEQQITWQPEQGMKGVFFVRLTAGGKSAVRKVVVF